MRQIPSRQRMRVLEESGLLCGYCGDPASEVDHIIPHSYVQKHDDENLVAACQVCNQIAGNKVFDGFIDKQTFILEKRKEKRWIEAIKLYRGLCSGVGLPLLPIKSAEETKKNKSRKETKRRRNIDGSSKQKKPQLPKPWKSRTKDVEKLPEDGRKNDLQGGSRPKDSGVDVSIRLSTLGEYRVEFKNLYTVLKSWRKVAESYGIYPNMARMISQGHDPGNKIRKKLRLPMKDKFEVCPRCESPMKKDHRCSKGNHNKRNRLSINLDDPGSAGRSIMKHMDSGVVDDLIVILMEKMLREG